MNKGKPIKITPPKNDIIGGRYYISPVDSWYEKGHFWSKDIQYEMCSIAVLHKGKTYYSHYWAKPKVTISNLGIKIVEQDNPCSCKDCVSGRKLVKKGWVPK